MPTINSLEDVLRRHADAFPNAKLDHKMDARELMFSRFGIGGPALRMAIETDPVARAMYDVLHHLIADILEVNYEQRRRKTVDVETAKTIFDAGWKAGTNAIAQGSLHGLETAKQAAFEMLLQRIDPTEPAKPTEAVLTPLCEPWPPKPKCDHNWRYTGTDGHGSHKGEDAYKCTKCLATEYRN